MRKDGCRSAACVLVFSASLLACGGTSQTSAPDASSDGAAPVTDGAASNDSNAGPDSTTPDAGPDAPIALDGGMDANGDASDAAPCTNPCEVGHTRCANGGIETCEAQGGGCPAWVQTATCSAHQACSIGGDAGVASCTCNSSTICEQNGAVCQDAQTLATCSTDTDGCVYVSATTTCASPQSCSGSAPSAACSLTCTDSCQMGKTACVSGGVATCVKGSNGCLAYGPPVGCPSARQSCAGGPGSAACTCNTDPTCQGALNYCNANATALVSCAQDPQGCWYPSATQACTGGACAGSPGLAACVTSPDAGPDGSTDASTDGSTDASTDGSTPLCGGTRCYAGQVCVNNACVFQGCVGTHVPGDYSTLNNAVTALASIGGTICLGAQTYDEDVFIDGSQPFVFQGVSSSATQVTMMELSDPSVTVKGIGLTYFGAAWGGTYLGPNSYKLIASRLGPATGGANLSVFVNNPQGSTSLVIDQCEITASIQLSQQYSMPSTTLSATVQNSYFHGGAGIQYVNGSNMMAGSTPPSATLAILNNSFIQVSKVAIDVEPTYTTWASINYYNNIIYGSTTTAIIFSSGVPFAHGNNALFANVTNYGGVAVDGPGYVKVDPMLDTSAAPPGLLPGSPCRGAGDSAHTSPHDYFGAPRGTSVDIGAVQSSP